MDPIKNPREQLDAVTQDGPPVESGQTAGDSVMVRRLERILEHQAQSQSDPNPMIAVLGGVSADLTQLELYVAGLLLPLLATAETIDTVDEQTQAINQMIRLAKQIGQFTQLELRLRKAASEEMTPPS